jgi:DNA-binding transcriptional MocR family regulator
MKLYETYAEELAQSIRQGMLKPGDRLPSVRHASERRGVSPSTVFAAYYLLEARGLIRARERFGYFVLAGAKSRLPEPDNQVSATNESLPVDVSDLVFDILESAKVRDVVPFGSAFPSPLLYPLQRLGRSLSASAAAMDPWSTVDDITPGNASLRRQIALRYLADGMHVHTDDIVIVNGALEGLNLSLKAVTRPGDAVVVESPAFYGALQALENANLRAIEVPVQPREGMDLQALQLAIEKHQPKAVWLMTNFQNPVGSLMPDAKKQALVDLLSAHDIPLIEDDVYGELYFGARRPLPAKAFDKSGIVLHSSSFSKCLAPGYRVGWTVGGRYAKAIARLKTTHSLSASAPAQAALADYLSKGGFDRHLRQLRHALQAQQSALLEAVGKHFPSGTRATRPDGGYFVWVELAGGVDALELHRRALSLGISVAPGPMFSAQRAFRHCIRLNYGHPWTERSEAAIATLGRLARSLAR